MINTLAIKNYRSILDLVIPLEKLNVITGPNGSGKSNLYRALRLLAETAHDGVVRALASEGGLQSTVWAGPETLSRQMLAGKVPVQGSVRKRSMRLKLGFAGDDFGYAISLGLPKPDSRSSFTLDPEIKSEVIWVGPQVRPSAILMERKDWVVRSRTESKWTVAAKDINSFDSVFGQLADPNATPEVFFLRERIGKWRFYDHFRTDRDSPVRQPQIGTQTPILSHDGSDLAAALQTIVEIGDAKYLARIVADAFSDAQINIEVSQGGRFSLQFLQPGLLRPLAASELSDGTLRFLLLAAALLTPRPPALMVLNEPETSLHPDVVPALAELIVHASGSSQVWVVTHSAKLIASLKKASDCNLIELNKKLGSTLIDGQDLLDRPQWRWPDNA